MPHEEQNDALKRNNKVAVDRYRFAVECLSDRPRIIADFGCGMGYGTYLLLEGGHDVTGMDNSKDAIHYAQQNYSCLYDTVDIENIDLSGAIYNTVVCLETLCHLKKPQEFIDKLTIKELIISAPIDPDPNDGYIYRLHNLSEKQFKDMLKDWEIINEFRQKKYLTIYAKKI